MLTKYINQLGKAEAEWALEVLDMHDGDEVKAREALLIAVTHIIGIRCAGEAGELTPFEITVEACCFASRDWWRVGLDRLRELGRLPQAVA